MPAAPVDTGPRPKLLPTILLVHGAFVDNGVWSRVQEQLSRFGTDVLAVTNPLRGLARDAGYLASVCSQVAGDVLLVGQCYGGAVTGVAAAAAGNVVGLVYVTGFALDVGESCVQVAGRHPPTGLAAALRPSTFPDVDGPGTELTVDRAQFAALVADGLEALDAHVAATSQRPVASSALDEPAASAGWRSLPSWYAVALDDRSLHPGAQQEMAARARAETVHVHAGHLLMMTRPALVAALIRDAAQTVSRHHDPHLP